MSQRDVPGDVADINRAIVKFLDTKDKSGNAVGNARCGIYAFYDYDGEPIYVGQTVEKLRGRIRRHLTNQRTDAVAMNVLDPFEVSAIEVWPMWQFQETPKSKEDKDRIQEQMNAYEYSAYQQLLSASKFKAILNEKDMVESQLLKLPGPTRGTIIPERIFNERMHPDIRIARRANTIAALTRVISERDVSDGLRRTLLTQARRLEDLSRRRFEQVMEKLATPAGAVNDNTSGGLDPDGTGRKPAQRVDRKKKKSAKAS